MQRKERKKERKTKHTGTFTLSRILAMMLWNGGSYLDITHTLTKNNRFCFGTISLAEDR